MAFCLDGANGFEFVPDVIVWNYWVWTRLTKKVLHPFKIFLKKYIKLFGIYLFKCFIFLCFFFFLRQANMILLNDSKKNVLFLSEPLRCDGFPPVCALSHTNMENKSNQMEAKVVMLVKRALFFSFCIFWLHAWSTWHAQRPAFWFRWKATPYSCLAQRGAPLLRHSTWRGMFGLYLHLYECVTYQNASLSIPH